MNKKRKLMRLIILILALGLVFAVVLFLIGFFKPKGAGIRIETIPASTVFVDGVQVGRTPYKDTRDFGEVTIKLIPESETPLVPFEKNVSLVSGIETVIFQEFAETKEKTSGEVVSFEKVVPGEVSLVVISEPNGAQVNLDDIIKGYTPVKETNLLEGEHTLKLTAPGYIEREIQLQAYEDHKITVQAKLAVDSEYKQEEEKETEEDLVEKELKVEILSTPTNFLRVRSEPDTSAVEVARVTPGEGYPFVSESDEGGWYEIVYEEKGESGEAKSGWVSATYAKKIEVSVASEEVEKTDDK